MMQGVWQLFPLTTVISEKMPIEERVRQNPLRTFQRYPAILGRIPLFLPCNERVRVEEMLQCRWGSVLFRQKCLNMTDEAIFIALVNRGGMFEGSITDLCRLTGLTSRDSVSKAVESLQNNLVEVTIKDSDVDFILRGALVKADGNWNNLTLKLHEQLICTTEQAKNDQHYRNIDMDIRAELSLTGKALHRFITSHKLEQSYGVELVRQAVAPLQRIDNLKQEIRKQLELMQSKGFLKSFALDRGKLKYVRVKTVVKNPKTVVKKVKTVGFRHCNLLF